ncbi:MAG: hypothetical protein HY791_18415 [Deltaproteobacteria bacterium]|nr:hypothetical protein [Deltaproteobacteria bacterium]
MTRVRLRAEKGFRTEDHLIVGRDFWLGRGDVDVEIDDEDVAHRHARLLVRRGRLVLAGVDSPIERRGDPIHAPVVLDADEPFKISGTTLRVRIADDDVFAGATIDGWHVGKEICLAGETDHRRFELASESGRAELLTPTLATEDFWRIWSTTDRNPGGQIPEIIALGHVQEHPYLIERLEPGMRLSTVFDQARKGRLTLPVELALVVLAQAAEAASRDPRGHHGAIEPEMIHLGESGSVYLVRPGPKPDGYGDRSRRAYLSEERRYGIDPTPADDVFALGVLARVFGEVEANPIFEALATRLTADRKTRPTLEELSRELVAYANKGPLDPSRRHVSGVVRLLMPDPKPLLRVRPR